MEQIHNHSNADHNTEVVKLKAEKISFGEISLFQFLNHSGHGQSMDLQTLNAEEVQNRIPLIIVIGCLSLVGLISNIHVLYIFHRKMRRSTYRVFVLSLGIIDVLGCTISMPFQIVDESHPLTFNSSIACKLFRYIDTNLAIASALMLVIIAMERYRKICTPKHVQVTELRAIHLSISVIFVSSLVTSPALVVYGRKTTHFSHHNITGSECSWDDSTLGSSYLGYLYYGLELLCIILCMVGIVILYSMVGAKIRTHTKSRGISLAARFDPLRSNGMKIIHRTEDGDEISFDRILNTSNDSDRTKLVTFKSFNKNIDNSDEKRVSYTAVDNIPDHSSENKDASTLQRSNKLKVQEINIVRTSLTGGDSVVDRHELDSNKAETDHTNFNGGDKQEAVEDSSRYSMSVSSREDKRWSTENTRTKSKVLKRQRNLYSVFTHYFRSKSKDMDTVRERRITKLLFFITLTFIITYSPYIAILVIYAVRRDFNQGLDGTSRAFYLMALRLYLLNNVTNAFFYGFFDLEFRNHCKMMYKGLYLKLQTLIRKRSGP